MPALNSLAYIIPIIDEKYILTAEDKPLGKNVNDAPGIEGIINTSLRVGFAAKHPHYGLKHHLASEHSLASGGKGYTFEASNINFYCLGYMQESLPDKYSSSRERAMQDFSDRVPGKAVRVFPKSVMGGILGFTYLGENFIGLRDDMVGSKMINIHEAIHTPDEYETRVLTSWIMNREIPRYLG